MFCVIQNCDVSSFSNHVDYIIATCDRLAKEKKKQTYTKKATNIKTNSIDHSVITDFHSSQKTNEVDKNLRPFLLWDVPRQGMGVFVGVDLCWKMRGWTHMNMPEKKQTSEEEILNMNYESWHQINFLRGRRSNISYLHLKLPKEILTVQTTTKI